MLAFSGLGDANTWAWANQDTKSGVMSKYDFDKIIKRKWYLKDYHTLKNIHFSSVACTVKIKKGTLFTSDHPWH